MTSAIVERDLSFEPALRRVATAGGAPRCAPGAREQSHHEKPGVERARATPAPRKKARQRERMSD